jgi:hypothetical protein
VTEDARFAELEKLARAVEPDRGRLHDLSEQLGADLAGLRELVERYGDSGNPILLDYVADPLVHATWWDPPEAALMDLVLEFMQAVGSTLERGVLDGCLGMLHGLQAARILRVDAEQDKELVGRLLLRCLDVDDVILRAHCIDVLGHLWSDGVLERVVSSSAVAALKERLVRLATDESEELGNDLASFREFWSG